ncbi:HlyD family type I secretion periplasmic adaptor subunit [Maridesulfovibrio salexigens]|uniref:Type I secretion membrane fusion protein, HlyD family n=1 Tax=Maridesulfovibrio salexigens (strain ATCC 14822 / DSM 2638 / NCIMB 8403 / VKM B-1763) TaxID=526222 RepID=C6C037_MARSD|nr:HlyD family type I secretion periplasmic adaptor subunit [Maridesulfovibrio salexigens]ACS80908.1 type I secretion membrane fusion protein, HlyD family [Maridesulfovibrio salexigens DSM 2638]
MNSMSPEYSGEVKGASHFFLFLCIVMCLAFLGWACYFQLDIVSQAEGEVIPSSRVKPVQHLEGGIIMKINVREGEMVAKGQELVVLEATASDSTVDELEVRVTSLRVNIARLSAEDQGLKAPDYPKDIYEKFPALIERSLKLFQTRKARVESDLLSEREKIKQREQDIKQITSRQRNSRNSLKLLREQIKISAGLLEDGLTSRYKHLGFLKEESKLKSSIEEDSAKLAKARSALAQAKADIGEIRNSYLASVREELQEARREFDELSQRLRKFEDNLNRTIIRSPVDGVVKTLYVVSVGEVVRPGMTIMDIVPAGDKLVIEARLPISDIGYVKDGQKAVVKLASSDAARFGNIDGKVVNISPDADSTDRGLTFYRVRIETDKDFFEHDGNYYKLFPGIRVIAGIHIGTRSVMEYILEPFMGSMSYAMRER